MWWWRYPYPLQDSCPVCRQKYTLEAVEPAMSVRRIVLGLEVQCPLTQMEGGDGGDRFVSVCVYVCVKCLVMAPL